jgi:TolB-like protein/Flp pilus assembly protein TadD
VGAWLLIQVVETIFPLFGVGDAPARLLVIILAIGFIPVLVISWVFEWTPEGLKRDDEIDASLPSSAHAGKTLNRLIMLALALALGLFAFDKFVLDPGRDLEKVEAARREGHSDAVMEKYGDRSIAVLPFADMSEEGDQQYLSDGLAEELLNLLAQVNELRVASRSSTFNLHNENLSVAEIAEKLNVGHILEGSVRLIGNQLRVTVQLIEAQSDTHLWSENYDRKFENIFAIQDDIAGKVVHELKVNLLGTAPHVMAVDPEAYDLVLQARFLRNRTDPNDSLRASALLEKAIAIDPEYFDAWYLLGGSYQRQATYGLVPQEEALEKSYAATDRAAKLDPGSAKIQSRLGWMAIRWDKDVVKAAEHYQRAVDMTEDPERKIHVASDFLRYMGYWDLLITRAERYIRKNPTDAKAHLGLVELYINVGRCREAVEHANTGLTLIPNSWNGRRKLAYALLCDGQWEAAHEIAVNASDVEMREPTRFGISAIALHSLGRFAESEALVEKMRLSEKTSHAWLAEVYTRRGEKEKAFMELEILSNGEYRVPWLISNDLAYADLYSDPRWRLFLEKTNRTPEDLAAIDFHVPVPESWK